MTASSSGLGRILTKLCRYNNITGRSQLNKLWSEQLAYPGTSRIHSQNTRTLTTEAQPESASSNAGILLSDRCVKRLQKIGASGEYLRIYVEGGGCSGFQYKFDIDTKVEEDDRLFERDGVGLVVDVESLEYLKGSTIDYQEELIRSAFQVVKNPKAEHGCSCGASFSLKV
ncbi:iron-sulfur cluster assembly 2 homolog, mitochondrial-like [Saccoglossus kowalevskii]|uniref:Iron-sulfur cluster assembly 2 homolog, mitochondrial-like n=1 Tax=Saccoglossus kowalevskii TaxID=10224 RepID=A0ABM0GXW0_SACKO|nr:PREDICTED: iron-sulfur cluster assembly 2 homolog, mitochondrial-like [Saccoglossus kowalevskii]